jgi:hypothetical protein
LNWAYWLYRSLAWISSGWLYRSGQLQAIWAHRSLATREIDPGRSDIDLVLLLHSALTGPQLSQLLLRVQRLRWCNPLLCQLELFRSEEFTAFARRDSAWSQLEREAHLPLWGIPPTLPTGPVEPRHALARFLFWQETHFSTALNRRSRRDLRKLALECWNYFLVASQQSSRLQHTRAQMAASLEESQPGMGARIDQPQAALTFVLKLAQELHRSLRPPLSTLPRICQFRIALPPFGVERKLVILPRPDFPLPVACFEPGVWTVTPEVLDLVVQFRNGFLWSLLPSEIQLDPPSSCQLLNQIDYFASPHFLHFPGFIDRRGPHPRSRLAYLHQALQRLEQGQRLSMTSLPTTWVSDPHAYYRSEYEPIRRFNQNLEQRVEALRVN